MCVCVLLQLLLGWLVFILARFQTFITSLLIAPFLHPSVPPAIYKSTADCFSLRANIQSFLYPLLSMLSSFALSHIFLCPNVGLKKRKQKPPKTPSLAVSQNRLNDGQVCVHLRPFLILSFVLLVVRVLICVALEHSLMNKSDDSVMKV